MCSALHYRGIYLLPPTGYEPVGGRKHVLAKKKIFPWIFETGSHYVFQTGLKLGNFLSQPAWDYRHVALCPTL
jgi:hypothetical protein